MLIKDIENCSTYSVRGLDNQLIAQMNKIKPGLLTRIDHLDVELGQAVHPWLQADAGDALAAAIKERSQKMTINSAYRTLAAQALLRSHYESGRCGITAAAVPGASNHNNASAIDIEDSHGWRPFLEQHGWQKLGSWDDMHFDFVQALDILNISILAFQQIWNICRPKDKLEEDGTMGDATLSRLRYAPAEGFPGLEIPRIMRLTEPLQVGDDVGELQIRLRDHGIEIAKADKVFGPATEAAVRQFQAAQEMIADGIAGDATRLALGL